MKLSIERKIMIPFLLLVLSLIVTISAVAYWGGYQFYANYRKDEAEKILIRAERFLKYENSEEENDKGKHLILSEFLGEDLAWIEKGHFTKLPYQLMPYREQILKINLEMSKESILKKDVLLYRGNGLFSENLWLVVSYFPDRDRLLGLPVLIEPFPEPLILFHKYILLVGILAGMLAIEITIFLSHHFTRPIKRLASICRELTPGEGKYNLPVDRRDEIGILAKSFQKMIFRVEENLKEIKQMQQFNDAIFNSISTAIVTTSLDGSHILKANPTALKILKLSDSEAIKKWGQNGHELLSLLRKICLERQSSNEAPTTWEHIIKYSEETLFISGRTDLVHNREGERVAVMLLFEDITEKRRIERNMERVKQLASFGEIAATLAHEIRNPLAGIKTCSQVLAERLSSDIKTNRLVKAISTEIDRINRLITNMLDLARPQTPKRTGVNLHDSLASIYNLLSKALKDKQIRFENRLPAAIPLLYVDSDNLKQILLNLVLNAIKATPEGTTIRISQYLQTADFFSFIISDEGTGIPPKNSSKIFQPFFSTDPRGTGLGLAVVQRLVNENGGEIDVHSETGQGAQIILKLPIRTEV